MIVVWWKLVPAGSLKNCGDGHWSLSTRLRVQKNQQSNSPWKKVNIPWKSQNKTAPIRRVVVFVCAQLANCESAAELLPEMVPSMRLPIQKKSTIKQPLKKINIPWNPQNKMPPIRQIVVLIPLFWNFSTLGGNLDDDGLVGLGKWAVGGAKDLEAPEEPPKREENHSTIHQKRLIVAWAAREVLCSLFAEEKDWNGDGERIIIRSSISSNKQQSDLPKRYATTSPIHRM